MAESAPPRSREVAVLHHGVQAGIRRNCEILLQLAIYANPKALPQNHMMQTVTKKQWLSQPVVKTILTKTYLKALPIGAENA